MDFSEVKKLTIPEGEVAKITDASGNVLWQAITFTNQVPISTDTNGSIYNGLGYKENVRLSSSGGVSSSAQNGSVTTGFIPWKNTDTVRVKGAEWLGTFEAYGAHCYFNLYDSGKNFISQGTAGSSGYNANLKAQLSVVYDETTGVTTFEIINPDGSTGTFRAAAKSAAYIRINAMGKGADLIVTINEEIT